MNKKTKFTLTALWILLTRSYDAYCTYQFTPNLDKEANPLVTVLGMSWTPLLLTVFSLTLYGIWCLYQSTFKPINLLPTESDYSLSEVSGYIYLGKRAPWHAIFYAFPKSLRRFNQYLGHTLSRCLVYAGFISTLMWLFIQNCPWYRSIHSGTLIYSLLLLGCSLILYQWYSQQYFEYLKNTAHK